MRGEGHNLSSDEMLCLLRVLLAIATVRSSCGADHGAQHGQPHTLIAHDCRTMSTTSIGWLSVCSAATTAACSSSSSSSCGVEQCSAEWPVRVYMLCLVGEYRPYCTVLIQNLSHRRTNQIRVVCCFCALHKRVRPVRVYVLLGIYLVGEYRLCDSNGAIAAPLQTVGLACLVSSALYAAPE